LKPEEEGVDDERKLEERSDKEENR